MHCTASGRALMYDFDDELIETLTLDDLSTPTSASEGPKDLTGLLRRIEMEWARGYSVASEEVEIGLTSASAAVRDQLGHIAGVLNVSAPTSRIITRTDSIGQLLIAASRAITQNLRSRRS